MQHAYTLKPGHPTPGQPNLLRPPIASKIGTGILTCFPSTTPFGLALGADSPCADERCAGNLGLSASGPFTRFIATHVSIRTSDISSIPYETPSQTYRTLSYHVHLIQASCLNLLTNLNLLRSVKGALVSAAALPLNLLRKLASPTRITLASSLNQVHIRSFGAWFEPRYIFRAGRLDQ